MILTPGYNAVSIYLPCPPCENLRQPCRASPSKNCHIVTSKKSDFRSICLHINQLCPPVPLPIEDACSMALEVIRLEQCDLRILILIV